MQWDSERWPDFTEDEMRCSHTGLCEMDPRHMDMMQELRRRRGAPVNVSSGYRHPTHPAEARKEVPGEHTLGKASDVECWSDEAFALAEIAFELGFTRIGVSQSGRSSRRFLHLGSATPDEGFPGALYSY